MAEPLTTYTGNAGLGIGSNASIPVASDQPLNFLNQTLRDVMLQNNDWNIRLYQQKIKDRDNLNELIVNNQLPVPKIDPEYQSYYDKARKEAEQKFLEWGGNFNNTAGFRAYQQAVQTAKDVASQASLRTLQNQKYMEERAKIGSPSKLREYDAWLEKEKEKPFWEMPGVYQPLFSWSADDVYSVPAMVSSTKSVTPDGVVSEKTDYFSYNDIVNHKKDQWLNNRKDERDSMEGFYNDFIKLPQKQQQDAVNNANLRLKKYNEEVGNILYGRALQDGDKEFAPDITGRESLAEFSSKMALAHQNAFFTKGQAINKDLGDYLISKQKADADTWYKKVMANNAAKKANAYVANVDSQIKSRNSQQEQDEFLSEIFNKNLTEQPTLVKTEGKKYYTIEIPANKSTPIWTFSNNKPQLLRPFGGKPIMDGKNIIGYTGGTYKQQYLLDGKSVKLNDLSKKYAEFWKLTTPEKREELGVNSIDDFIKANIKKGLLKVNLEGENGTTNETLNAGALRFISNAGTKKGQQQPFSDTDNELNEE